MSRDDDRDGEDKRGIVSREGTSLVQGGAGGMAMTPEVAQAQAEVQGRLVMAFQCPRDLYAVKRSIEFELTDVELAEQATYAYPRGGQMVEGPSIRLAEVLAQNMRNFESGVREISQDKGRTRVEAYAWDLESNVRESRTFIVEHVRDTRRGRQQLTDPRDIYELAANLGARRKRACILALVPRAIQNHALKVCGETLSAEYAGDPEEALAKLVPAFEKLGVTEAMLAQKLGHAMKKIKPAELVALRRIYSSINDGISKPQHWFDVPEEPDEKTRRLQEEIDGEGGNA